MATNPKPLHGPIKSPIKVPPLLRKRLDKSSIVAPGRLHPKIKQCPTCPSAGTFSLCLGPSLRVQSSIFGPIYLDWALVIPYRWAVVGPDSDLRRFAANLPKTGAGHILNTPDLVHMILPASDGPPHSYSDKRLRFCSPGNRGGRATVLMSPYCPPMFDSHISIRAMVAQPYFFNARSSTQRRI